MKPYLLSNFLAICLLFSLSQIGARGHVALDCQNEDTYFNHLQEINGIWKSHEDASLPGTVSFSSDLDRIQLHLNLVIDYLRKNQPSGLSFQQFSHRTNLLEKLQKYSDRKVFPVNLYHNERRPYFVDHRGIHCAVGQMMANSGHADLVAQISRDHNFDYLVDIRTEGVLEWADSHGFTTEELQWIQPGYPPIGTFEQVLGATNGKVNIVEYNGWNGSVTIAGEFTELDSLPCAHIGIYQDDQLSCLGSGIDGVINDVMHCNGAVYAFGELLDGGNIFPMAIFYEDVWTFHALPEREGAKATAASFNGIGCQMVMTVHHPSFPDYQEIWVSDINLQWERTAKVHGFINDIEGSYYGRVYAGHVDSVLVFDANQEMDSMFIVNNLFFHHESSDSWFGADENISDTVFVAFNFAGTIYLGGACGGQPGQNNICMTRYFNNSLQPLFLNNSPTEQFQVNDIAFMSGTDLVFGGNFSFNPDIGTFGNNLATFDLVNNAITPLALLDEPIKTLSMVQGTLYFGGSFQTNLTNQTIRYLGRQIFPVSTSDTQIKGGFEVYPNPFQDVIHLNGVRDGTAYSIQSVDGKTVREGVVTHQRIQGLEGLSSGIFLLRIESEKTGAVKRIVK
jgi:hypothetical protein